MRWIARCGRRAGVVICAAMWVSCVSSASERTQSPKVRCCQGKDLRWRASDLPLTVWFDPTLPPSHRRAYELISDQINRLAGLVVFRTGRPAPKLADRVVVPRGTIILLADAAAKQGLTDLRHDPRTGELDSASITLPELIHDYRLRYLMTHELLHALGYDHGAATTRAQLAILRAALDLEFIRADYGDPAPGNLAIEPSSTRSVSAP